MITQGEAKRHIVGLWPGWAAEHLDAERRGRISDALLFFAFLSTRHPNLLEFSYKGLDKSDIVHKWLSQARCCD